MHGQDHLWAYLVTIINFNRLLPIEIDGLLVSLNKASNLKKLQQKDVENSVAKIEGLNGVPLKSLISKSLAQKSPISKNFWPKNC